MNECRTKKERLLPLFAVLYLIAAVLFLSGRADAAAAPILSAKKITAVEFTTRKLRLKGAPAGSVTWKSSNQQIARVNARGQVSALRPGSCRITAGYQGKTYTCRFTVEKLAFPYESVTMVIDARPTFKLKFNHAGLSASPQLASYRSSNAKIVSVTKEGMLRAKRPGSCRITVKYKGRTLTLPVKVCASPYKALKKAYPPVKANRHKIILAGSSTIERWKNAGEALAPYGVINMGMSFTRVEQWLTWYKDLIVPYKPDAVILYVGNNDIGNGKISGAENAQNTAKLLQRLSRALPDTQIFYVSLLNCWYRQNAWDEVRESNRQVKKFCAGLKNVTYIHIQGRFTDEAGRPREELFGEDRLHPNDAGYEIWRRVVGGAVKKKLGGK